MAPADIRRLGLGEMVAVLRHAAGQNLAALVDKLEQAVAAGAASGKAGARPRKAARRATAARAPR